MLLCIQEKEMIDDNLQLLEVLQSEDDAPGDSSR